MIHAPVEAPVAKRPSKVAHLDPNNIAPGKTPFFKRFPAGVSWMVTGWMAVMHVGAVAAFWYVSWQAIAVFFALHFVTACFGITLGYHRLLTHGSFVCASWFKYFCSICGMLSAEGSPLQWVATHRKHHVHSDGDEDPHSPLHGFWWSHMLWFYPYESAQQREALYLRWAPDIYKDRSSGSSTARSSFTRSCWGSACIAWASTPSAASASRWSCGACVPA